MLKDVIQTAKYWTATKENALQTFLQIQILLLCKSNAKFLCHAKRNFDVAEFLGIQLSLYQIFPFI